MTLVDPTAVVEDKPVGDTTAAPVTVTEPIAVVDATPVTSTCSMSEPYDPAFQVERPQPTKVGMVRLDE